MTCSFEDYDNLSTNYMCISLKTRNNTSIAISFVKFLLIRKFVGRVFLLFCIILA